MKGVYLVTDRSLCLGRPLTDVIARAVAGGICCVQLREKGLSTREFVREAKAVRELLCPFSVPLIINDRVDVALACGAEGVHLGQNDMPYADARKLMGEKAIIGLSVETWDEVKEAQDLEVAYIAASPVFATPTKTDTKEPWGLDGLKRIRAASRHPVVAIGGINVANAPAVIRAGADCLAVVSAICSAPDPAAAAAELGGLIQREFLIKRT